MGMFDTVGKGTSGQRSEKAMQKCRRLAKVFSHQEPDRVPISDFFWGSFIERWKKDLGLSDDANPYYYYDLDWIVTLPNMDPKIRPFETVEENDRQVIVKTGFGAIMRKLYKYPMPEFVGWEVDTIDKLERFRFDAPDDQRRFYEAGDNQIAGVGDGFQRNTPPWIETVRALRPDFPVFGSIIECSECCTRLIGQENTLLWMGLYPERFGDQINRIGEFYFEMAKAQIAAADGLLDGFVIWGDIAYNKGLMFSPDYWRRYFKPWVKAVIEYCHQKDLPVIYHGCGDVRDVFGDFVEMRLDAYNPLEAKAAMDAVELRRRFGHKIGFCGNSDIQVWESGDKQAIKREVLRKLNAAKGGGFIFQSDHSVSSNISGHTYDYIVKLVREYGKYPLDLGGFDEEI